MSSHFSSVQALACDTLHTWDSPVSDARAAADVRCTETAHTSVHDEAALELVEKLFVGREEECPHVSVFAGVGHGSGCTEVASAVARVLAESAKYKVCLVEANFRSPRLSQAFTPQPLFGLTDALTSDISISSALQRTSSERLSVLPAGRVRSDSPGLLATQRMQLRMKQLRSQVDFVVIDAPPLSPYPDALTLGKMANGMVIVIEAEETRREAALVAVAKLRSAEVNILGAVLNKRKFPIPRVIYERI